jgi:hypothetical protein
MQCAVQWLIRVVDSNRRTQQSVSLYPASDSDMTNHSLAVDLVVQLVYAILYCT